MRLAEFDVPFDPSLVAERPSEPRDHARLLTVPRAGGAPAHHRVYDLPALLRPGDLLVVNDTKVLPVRLIGRKVPGGGRVDVLLVRDLGGGLWEALLRGRVRVGQVVDVPGGEPLTVVERTEARTLVRVAGALSMADAARKFGRMPLPPYIKREPRDEDRDWYQTLFATREGAIAAPTAGLHFTARLLEALRARGIEVVTVTLQVGPGTFLPVKTDRVEEHRLAAERVEVSEASARAVNETRRNGGRIVAVGTTVVRSLEAAADEAGRVAPMTGETDLFILPGYRFRAVDGVMTNFHLPRTTLVMLVAAFAGKDRLAEAYGVAVRERYRFYSYGDAMLIV